MLLVTDLIQRGFGRTALPDGCAMFCGTFAAKGGIRPAARFDYQIEDPVLKRSISHGYNIITLPVLGWKQAMTSRLSLVANLKAGG